MNDSWVPFWWALDAIIKLWHEKWNQSSPSASLGLVLWPLCEPMAFESFLVGEILPFFLPDILGVDSLGPMSAYVRDAQQTFRSNHPNILASFPYFSL